MVYLYIILALFVMVLIAIVLFVARFYMARANARKDLMVEYEQRKALQIIEAAQAKIEENKRKKSKYSGRKPYQKVSRTSK